MKKLATLAAMAVLAAALSACGGGNNGNANNSGSAANSGAANSAAASGNTVAITATNFEFDQDTYKVKAGDVTINFESAEGVHGIEIKKTGVKLQGGESKTVTLDKPGEYEIFCNIPCGTGHIKMKATLVVEA